MSNQQDQEEIGELQELNAELTASLSRCRALLRDCKSKLAANSNDPQSGNDDEDGEADEEAYS